MSAGGPALVPGALPAALRAVFSPCRIPVVSFSGSWEPRTANLSYCRRACFPRLPLMQFYAYRYLRIKGWKVLQRCLSDSCALNRAPTSHQTYKCLVRKLGSQQTRELILAARLLLRRQTKGRKWTNQGEGETD